MSEWENELQTMLKDKLLKATYLRGGVLLFWIAFFDGDFNIYNRTLMIRDMTIISHS